MGERFAPHGASELKETVAPVATGATGFAPHGASALKFEENPD